MIFKSYEINQKQKIVLQKNIFLLYGENYGLKKEIAHTIKSFFAKDDEKVEKISLLESDILKNEENFNNLVFSNSLFNSKKIIFIYQSSDKIINQLKKIFEKISDDIFILLFADSLEKKSKLRNFFEMEENLGCSACYLDEEKSLEIITKQELEKENILLSKEALNLIVRKANGDRGSLRNELEKIKSFSQNNKKIDYEEIKHLVNSSGEIKFDNLVNSCLCGDTSTLKKNLVDFTVESINQILLLKILGNKIRRLILIKKQENANQSIDHLINSVKPPIFWKDKPIIKKQLSMWKTKNLIEVIQEINDIEISCRKNYQVAPIIFFNFFTSLCKKANCQI